MADAGPSNAAVKGLRQNRRIEDVGGKGELFAMCPRSP